MKKKLILSLLVVSFTFSNSCQQLLPNTSTSKNVDLSNVPDDIREEIEKLNESEDQEKIETVEVLSDNSIEAKLNSLNSVKPENSQEQLIDNPVSNVSVEDELNETLLTAKPTSSNQNIQTNEFDRLKFSISNNWKKDTTSNDILVLNNSYSFIYMGKSVGIGYKTARDNFANRFENKEIFYDRKGEGKLASGINFAYWDGFVKEGSYYKYYFDIQIDLGNNNSQNISLDTYYTNSFNTTRNEFLSALNNIEIIEKKNSENNFVPNIPTKNKSYFNYSFSYPDYWKLEDDYNFEKVFSLRKSDLIWGEVSIEFEKNFPENFDLMSYLHQRVIPEDSNYTKEKLKIINSIDNPNLKFVELNPYLSGLVGSTVYKTIGVIVKGKYFSLLVKLDFKIQHSKYKDESIQNIYYQEFSNVLNEIDVLINSIKWDDSKVVRRTDFENQLISSGTYSNKKYDDLFNNEVSMKIYPDKTLDFYEKTEYYVSVKNKVIDRKNQVFEIWDLNNKPWMFFNNKNFDNNQKWETYLFK